MNSWGYGGFGGYSDYYGGGGFGGYDGYSDYDNGHYDGYNDYYGYGSYDNYDPYAGHYETRGNYGNRLTEENVRRVNGMGRTDWDALNERWDSGFDWYYGEEDEW